MNEHEAVSIVIAEIEALTAPENRTDALLQAIEVLRAMKDKPGRVEFKLYDADTARNIFDKSDFSPRPIRQTVINQYASAMLTGRWTTEYDNESPITISRSGNLEDGYHRLLAVVQASATRPGFTIRINTVFL